MMAGITISRNTEQVHRRGPPMRSRTGRFASDEPMMSFHAGVVMEPSVFSAPQNRRMVNAGKRENHRRHA